MGVCNDLEINVDRYHPSSNAIGILKDSSGQYSWYKPLSRGRYNSIVFLPGCKLPDTNAIKALIRNAIMGLAPGGTFVLPFNENGTPYGMCGIPQVDLVEILGDPIKRTDEIAVFQPAVNPTDQQKENSVIDWFLSDTSGILARYSESQFSEIEQPHSFLSWKESNPKIEWEIDTSHINELQSDFLSPSFEKLSRFLVFSIQGVSAKSLAIGRIINDCFGRDCYIRWNDLGSGAGLVGIELLLGGYKKLRLTNIDKSLAQTMLGVDALSYFSGYESVFQRCKFKTVNIQNSMLFERNSVDLISMITTLCYIPKDCQHGVLKRVWDALKHGGCLLVYENAKSIKYSRDYDLMFEGEDLDRILRELGGELEHRHAQTGQPITINQARGKTCYRLVRKK